MTLDDGHGLQNIEDICCSRILASRQLFSFTSAPHLCYPGLSDEEFWPRVDTTITTFRKQSSSDVELDKCFNAIYEEDKKTYGDPADTEYKTVDDAAVSGWQATLIKHAKAVQPTPQQAQGVPPQKRRRIEVDGGSNASDGEDQ
ncbi:hypothetical protein FB451DRAFT_1200725 [Mycena latifolia]|nr:hypothetical protein FB451DRAFT_1200725 [Mycena latifolia]